VSLPLLFSRACKLRPSRGWRRLSLNYDLEKNFFRMAHMLYLTGQQERLHNAYLGACRTFDESVLRLFAPQGGV
jgi:hypothetical protein